MFTMILQALTLLMVSATTMAKIIDLSHPHGPDTIMSTSDTPHYNRTIIFAGDYIPGVYFEIGYYTSGEHGGTHIDAPKHFIIGARPLDKIPVEDTIADGVMIDCSKEAMAKNDYAVPITKIQEWEAENGGIPQKAAILFNFGWSSKFNNETLYKGTSHYDDATKITFPYLSREAGKWLFDQGKVQLIGTDTLSIDPFQRNGVKDDFPIHMLYLANNIVLVENLRDLARLPARGFRFHATPVQYVNATGAQVRAFAMTYDDDTGNGNGASVTYFSFVLVCGSLIVKAVFA